MTILLATLIFAYLVWRLASALYMRSQGYARAQWISYSSKRANGYTVVGVVWASVEDLKSDTEAVRCKVVKVFRDKYAYCEGTEQIIYRIRLKLLIF